MRLLVVCEMVWVGKGHFDCPAADRTDENAIWPIRGTLKPPIPVGGRIVRIDHTSLGLVRRWLSSRATPMPCSHC